jgi:hypothetical protein
MCVETRFYLALSKPSVDMLLYWDRVNHLYYLRCQILPAEGEVHVSLATWHIRLGYPSMDIDKRMSKLQAVKGLGKIHDEKTLSCDACAAA